MNKENKNIALIDLDGTLADYNLSMNLYLEKIRNPTEPKYELGVNTERFDYIKERIKLISSNGEWWENLPKFKLGFDILEILRKNDFYVTVLTQGPKDNATAWAHKVIWCRKNIPDLDVTITRNKGLVYGKILVDDYPEYIEQWLKWRPRGIVIMPANESNKTFKHKHVHRYDGANLDEIEKIINLVKSRESGIPLTIT